MTRREQLQEQYDESLFALLMDDIAISEGEAALRELADLKNDPNADVPKLVSARSRKTITRYFRRETNRRAGRSALRVMNRIACVMALMMVITITALAASEDFRVNTLNLTINVLEKSTQLSLTNESEVSELPELDAAWLPDGYELTSIDVVSDRSKVYYYTCGDKTIQTTVILMNTTNSLNVDTEDALVESIIINGYEGLYIAKYGYNHLAWINHEYSIFIGVLSYNEDIETLLEFSESLIFK